MGLPVPSTITKEWLIDQLKAFDLLSNVDGRTVPTTAGYLLFATAPQTRIKGAATHIMSHGRVERKLTGNLWTQLEGTITILEEINTPFILKSSTSEVVYPYPKIALRELSANALVHRSYEKEGELIIEIDEDSICFTNPGGLVDTVAEKARPSLQQQIEHGVRGITGYRNPVLADLLCGAGKIEKRGSGLPDVHIAVSKNGGTLRFGPLDETNAAFTAILFSRKEAVDEGTRTATPASNRSTYYTNLLEVTGLPPVVFSVTEDGTAPRDVGNNSFVPVARGPEHRILTFADPDEVNVHLPKPIVPGSSRAHRDCKLHRPRGG